MKIAKFAFFCLLLPIMANAEPLNISSKTIKLNADSNYTFATNKVQIIVLATPWCPPCIKTINLANKIANEYNSTLSVFNIDNKKEFDNAKIANIKTYQTDKNCTDFFGLSSRVPLVLVADKSGAIVKRFEAVPNETILNDLVKRLSEDRLENGTPSANNRTELWKKPRYNQ